MARDPSRSHGRWLLVAVAAIASCRGPSRRIELGQALFIGTRPLTARLAGHGFDLPQMAVRCTNCHRREDERCPAAASSQDFAPALGPARLTRPMPRRGGPPSTYDRAGLCRLLGAGVDPAFVMIAQAMPRYVFTDEECGDLWAFLTSSAPGEPCCCRDARS
jgi:hypothetical protein